MQKRLAKFFQEKDSSNIPRFPNLFESQQWLAKLIVKPSAKVADILASYETNQDWNSKHVIGLEMKVFSQDLYWHYRLVGGKYTPEEMHKNFKLCTQSIISSLEASGSSSTSVAIFTMDGRNSTDSVAALVRSAFPKIQLLDKTFGTELEADMLQLIEIFLLSRSAYLLTTDYSAGGSLATLLWSREHHFRWLIPSGAARCKNEAGTYPIFHRAVMPRLRNGESAESFKYTILTSFPSDGNLVERIYIASSLYAHAALNRRLFLLYWHGPFPEYNKLIEAWPIEWNMTSLCEQSPRPIAEPFCKNIAFE